MNITKNDSVGIFTPDDQSDGLALVMPAEEATFLAKSLTKTSFYLEYGSGGSTLLAVRLGVPNVVSVESDREFATAVRQQAAEISSPTKLVLLSADIGPTGAWGYPLDSSTSKYWPRYTTDVWDTIRPGASPEFILIDGRFRVASLMATLLRADPGTTIMFDDLRGRWNAYGALRAVIDPITMIGRAGIFEVPSNLNKSFIQHIHSKFACDPR